MAEPDAGATECIGVDWLSPAMHRNSVLAAIAMVCRYGRCVGVAGCWRSTTQLATFPRSLSCRGVVVADDGVGVVAPGEVQGLVGDGLDGCRCR